MQPASQASAGAKHRATNASQSSALAWERLSPLARLLLPIARNDDELRDVMVGASVMRLGPSMPRRPQDTTRVTNSAGSAMPCVPRGCGPRTQ